MDKRKILILRFPFFVLLLAFLTGGAYLAFALTRNGDFGFPLDDAWIHQVYARNLGAQGEFAFFPGQPSAGSTSPLWAILLSLGYLVRIDFRLWTILLGSALLAGSAWLSEGLAQKLANAFGVNLPRGVAALLILVEWHLVWATVSGMEVLLFVFLELLLVAWFFENRNAFGLGIIAGLLTLTRPEGAVLGGLVFVGLIVRVPRIGRTQGIMPTLASFALAFALLIVPYLAFNLATSGTLLPNTFYAKSEEYLALTNDPLIVRWFTLWLQPLIGAQILLLPGVAWFVWDALQKQENVPSPHDLRSPRSMKRGGAEVYFQGRWQRCARKWKMEGRLLIPLAWIILLITLYAIRLPVSYQHGRYEMPIIPFVLIHGLVGTRALMDHVARVMRLAWAMAVALLALAFWIIGAQAYTTDTAIINCEMVATAKWSAQNIPAGQLIAVHDIGAQGYFDSHPILDLAGLVTPDVIPFIRDETYIRSFIIERGARYAIFFPSWYPHLATDESFTPVFTSHCAITKEQGGENLSVYEVGE